MSCLLCSPRAAQFGTSVILHEDAREIKGRVMLLGRKARASRGDFGRLIRHAHRVPQNPLQLPVDQHQIDIGGRVAGRRRELRKLLIQRPAFGPDGGFLGPDVQRLPRLWLRQHSTAAVSTP